MYWPALDGLRGLAVLLVVVSHVGLLPEWSNAGYDGVVVFFVLSGFLITTLLTTSALEGRGHLPQFYATRAVRLWPALLLTTLVVSVVWLASTDLPPRWGSRRCWPSRTWRTFPRPSPGCRASAHLVPVGGRAVLPAVALRTALRAPAGVGCGARTWTRAVLLGLGIVASGVVHAALVLAGAANQAYASLPSNALALLAGCAIALLPLPRRVGPWSTETGVLGLVLALSVVPRLTAGDYLSPLLVVASACLMVVGLRQGAVGFRSAPARYLGRVSYSWYLWHWPLLWFSGTLGKPLSGSVVALCALGVAAVSTHLLEEPLRRAWRRRLAARIARGATTGDAYPAVEADRVDIVQRTSGAERPPAGGPVPPLSADPPQRFRRAPL